MSLGEHGFLLQSVGLHQEMLRVPLVIQLPDSTAGGEIVQELVSLVDVSPTIQDLAGSVHRKEIQGKSLLPILSGQSETRAVFSQAYEESALAVVKWPYKLIQAADVENPPSYLPDGRLLYHLKDDPMETTNLLDEFPSQATDLLGEWVRLESETVSRFRPIPAGE